MKESRVTGDSLLTAYDLDQVSGVPQTLRLRTIHLLALFVGAASIGAAIEYPRAWQLVALGDLAVMSLLFALAAGREWFLRYRPYRRLMPSRFVNVAGPRLEYQTAIS